MTKAEKVDQYSALVLKVAVPLFIREVRTNYGQSNAATEYAFDVAEIFAKAAIERGFLPDPFTD